MSFGFHFSARRRCCLGRATSQARSPCLTRRWGALARRPSRFPCARSPPPSRTKWTRLVPPSRTKWTRLVPPSRTKWTRLVPPSSQPMSSRQEQHAPHRPCAGAFAPGLHAANNPRGTPQEDRAAPENAFSRDGPFDWALVPPPPFLPSPYASKDRTSRCQRDRPGADGGGAPRRSPLARARPPGAHPPVRLNLSSRRLGPHAARVERWLGSGPESPRGGA